VIELRTDQAISFKWYSGAGLVPASLTAKLYDRSSSLIVAGVVALPTASTTVVAQSAAYFDVVSSAGMSAGDRLSITNDGVAYVRELARIESAASDRLYLAADLPVALDTGDAVVGLTSTITFAAVSATIGEGYRVELVATDAGGVVERAVLGAAVVRWTWEQCAAADVARVLSAVFQDERSRAFCVDVADRVNAKIEHALDATGRRPWLYSGASNLFSEVIQSGVRYVLADCGIAPTGDLVSILREMRFAFDDSLRAVVAGLREYDGDDDGETVANDRPLYSIRTIR